MEAGRNCPICGKGQLVRDSRPTEYTFRGINFNVGQPGLYCPACGESFLSSEDLRASEDAVRKIKREIGDLLTPVEIKQIRLSQKLSQKEAGILFGGGPTAFSKYERGEILQSKPLDIILRLLKAGKLSVGDIRENLDPARTLAAQVAGSVAEPETAIASTEHLNSINLKSDLLSIAAAKALAKGKSLTAYLDGLIENDIMEFLLSQHLQIRQIF